MRLNQAARKFNVATDRLVTYLAEQGISISHNPNTKLSKEEIEHLEKAFAPAKTAAPSPLYPGVQKKSPAPQEPSSPLPDKGAQPVGKEHPPLHKITAPRLKGITSLGTISLTKPKPPKPIPSAPPPKRTSPLAPADRAGSARKESVKAVEATLIPTSAPEVKGPVVLGQVTLPKKKERSHDKPTPSSPEPNRLPRRRIVTSTPASSPPFSRKFTPGRGPRPSFQRKPPAGKRGKYKKEKRTQIALAQEKMRTQASQEAQILKVMRGMTVHDLSTLMEVSVMELLGTVMELGMVATINQRLEEDTIRLLAEAKGRSVKFITEEEKEKEKPQDLEEDLLPRAPVITVMGHVDHGKTSLLDYIRKSQVAQGEAGGITQHIGAYEVVLEDQRKMAFLDTPGHEAFTAMRARGTQLTDVAIIVVAADDGVMPQTKEAIHHVQLANTPFVLAITKADKSGVRLDQVKEQLARENVMVEEWGGKYQCQAVSSLTGEGIPELLEKVMLEAELLDLKANPNKKAVGTVIEASLDTGRGYITTVMVEGGTLRVGDILLAGHHHGKVKALFNGEGKRVREALPATPVQVLGLGGAPPSGESFKVMESERDARELAQQRKRLLRDHRAYAHHPTSLDALTKQLESGQVTHTLNLLIKGDVDGSVEALADVLLLLSSEQVKVNVIYKAVGSISDSDILLAAASKALVIGFQTKVTPQAKKIAAREQVKISMHQIIYEATDYVQAQIQALIGPSIEEQVIARAVVKKRFEISKVGVVAGCLVSEGTIKKGQKIRIVRAGEVIQRAGVIKQLKREKEVIKEAHTGTECGIQAPRLDLLQEGDLIEAYQEKEVS